MKKPYSVLAMEEEQRHDKLIEFLKSIVPGDLIKFTLHYQDHQEHQLNCCGLFIETRLREFPADKTHGDKACKIYYKFLIGKEIVELPLDTLMRDVAMEKLLDKT